MESAYPVIAPISPVLRAICEQDRAEGLLAAGLQTDGTRLLRQAVRSYGARRLRQRQAEAELTLARSLLTQSPEEACVAARRARARFSGLGAEAWRARADAVALAAEVELGHRGPSLLTRGDELIEQLTAQGLHWGATSVRLSTARVLSRRGDHRAARQRIARLRIDDEAPLAVRLLARDVRAELAARQGRRSVALGQLREGLTDLHLWQSSFGSLDLQTMVAGHGTRLAVRGLALAVESGRPEVLFEWSERARMLASRVTPVRAPADDTITRDLAELRRLATPSDGPRTAGAGRDAELRSRVREKAWQHARVGRGQRAVRPRRAPGRAGPGHRAGRLRRHAPSGWSGWSSWTAAPRCTTWARGPGSTRCSAACGPTWTSPRPTSPPRWRQRCAASSPPGSTTSPRCSSRRWPRLSAAGAWS